MSNFRVSPEVSLEDGIDLYQAQVQKAQTVLAQKGFTNPQMPSYVDAQRGQIPYRGEMPPDLTGLDDQQLGWYMGMLSEWNAYVQYQLAEADYQLSLVKAEKALVEAKLRIMYKLDEEGKKRSNPERDDYVNSDRRFVEVQAQESYWETMWRVTKAIAISAEQNFSAVSRRITQRGQEIDRTNRQGGVTGHGNLPQGPLFPTAGPRRAI